MGRLKLKSVSEFIDITPTLADIDAVPYTGSDNPADGDLLAYKSGKVSYIKQSALAGGGTAENIITTSELTYPLTLLPNTFYKITATATAFTFTLGTPTAGIVNEYMLQITWNTTIGTVAFPSGIVWADTGVDIDDLELGYTYSVSILNGIGIIMGVEL